ncbi:MAG: HAD-IIA family hydrolase [Dehalococcoidia bacterium]
MQESVQARDSSAYRALLIDIDGTVIAGRRVLPGAPELLQLARKDGRRFVFLSNNSFAWPAETAATLTGLGLACEEGEVISAGHLAAERAAERSKRGIFVLGSQSLVDMVTHAGGNVTEDGPDVVLVGLDRGLTYPRLSIACRALLGGAKVVAVNRDWTVPTDIGLEPGIGVLLSALRAYKPMRPLICGKPSPVLAHAAQQRLGAELDEMLMIGDSLDVDMRMAHRAGIAGAVIKTGVVASKAVEREVRATYTFCDLPALLAWMRAG